MGKEIAKTAVRDAILEKIVVFLREEYQTDVEAVGSGIYMMPCLDPDGNEIFAQIKVSIPRGTRNGSGGYDPYDGYAEAEAYRLDTEDKAAKKAADEALKKEKVEEAKRKKEEKKALAEANKGLKELRKIKDTPAGE